MNQNTLHYLAIKSALIFGTVATAGLMAPAVQADIRGAGTGGTLCKAASGPGAEVFYFDNRSAQNVSSAVQYLSCSFTEVFDPVASNDATALNIGLGNPTGASVNFTCVVQAGVDGYSTTNSAVKVQSVSAGNTFQNIFMNAGSTPALPVRPNSFVGYTVSCAVPPQGKVNMVQIQVPTP